MLEFFGHCETLDLSHSIPPKPPKPTKPIPGISGLRLNEAGHETFVGIRSRYRGGRGLQGFPAATAWIIQHYEEQDNNKWVFP